MCVGHDIGEKPGRLGSVMNPRPTSTHQAVLGIVVDLNITVLECTNTNDLSCSCTC